MLIVHVHIKVKPDQVDAFRAACVENSRNSLLEPGIAVFDVLQQQDDPTSSCSSRAIAPGRPGGSQADGALQTMGRDRGRYDGGPAAQREVSQGLSRRRPSDEVRVRHGRPHPLRRRHVTPTPRTGEKPGRGRAPRGGAKRPRKRTRWPQVWPRPGSARSPSMWTANRRFGLVDEAKDLALGCGCELVIAIGGGSVIDAGKAVAGMLNNPGTVMDYLEVVGGGRPILRPAAPLDRRSHHGRHRRRGDPQCRARGTGSPREGQSASHHLLATIAVIDPELTVSLPAAITAYTGLDALTQLIEPFVSSAANPSPTAFAARASRWPLVRWPLPVAMALTSSPART